MIDSVPGEIHGTVPVSMVEPLGAEHASLRLYLAHNEPLEHIMFDRNLIGIDFRRTCLAASRLFVRHLDDEVDWEDAAELVILSKGLAYQLGEAVASGAGRNLATNLIATSRTPTGSGHVAVEISYARLETPGRTLVVGDTVASGATIVAAVGEYLRHHELERLYVVSYAGTLDGARRIAAFCAERGVKATFLFGLAAFGLADNGFDLSFLHPETITRDEYRQRAVRQFHGRAVSAVGWDFGAQSMAPRKYRELCWMESDAWGLRGEPCFRVAEKPRDLTALDHERPAWSTGAGRLDDEVQPSGDQVDDVL